MLTFLAALRHDRIEAPCVIDGPIGGESFLTYAEPALKAATLSSSIISAVTRESPSGAPSAPPAQTVFPAALQPRPQCDREGFCQAQNPAPKGCRADRRGLLRQRWICLNVKRSRSSAERESAEKSQKALFH
jgi:hypothetical protein